MSSFRISQLAERSGFPASTLRFYESFGLLPAQRSASGYRLYDDSALARLSFIASGKHLGLALEEIRTLLDVWERGRCSDVRNQLLPLIRDRIADADARIAQLTVFCARLADVHDQISAAAPEDGGCRPGCGCLTSPDAAIKTPAEPQPVDPLPIAALPIACTLDDAAMTARIADWWRLLARSQTRELIDDGVRIGFPADPTLALEITGLAVAEQNCCTFFDFTLNLTPTAFLLTVRAPKSAADLLIQIFH